MSDGEDTSPEDDEKVDAEAEAVRWNSPAFVVKWLVPSFAVLFVLVGYVVHSAHESLLGFPTTDGGQFEKSAFSADAADFLRDLLTTIGQLVFDDLLAGRLPLGGHGWLIFSCLLGALIAVAVGRLRGLRDRPRLVAGMRCVLLAALFSAKFIMLDAPMSHLENVVVGSAELRAVDDAKLGSPPAHQQWQILGDSAGIEGDVRRRTADLWQRMVCSRVAGLTFEHNPDYSGANCRTTASTNISAGDQTRDALIESFEWARVGQYVANILASLFIATIAVGLLRSRLLLPNILALLALFSLLSVPYSYGKLMKPLDFAFARITLAKEATHTPSPIYGFLIARTADYTDLLEAVDEPCSDGMRRELRFTSLPVGQIVAVEQIYRRDLITWKVENEAPCPGAPSPNGLAKESKT